MPMESAYTLSDIYIKQMDKLQTEDEISDLHKTLVFDYTKRMKTLYRENAYSKPVTMAVNYIEKHLHDKISSGDLAACVAVNKTYLLCGSEQNLSVQAFQKRDPPDNRQLHKKGESESGFEYVAVQ